MSQRYENIDKDIDIDLSLTVNLNRFSNHDGFSEGQLQKAIKEFEEKIKQEIIDKIAKEYFSEEFLNFADFVTYEIKVKDDK